MKKFVFNNFLFILLVFICFSCSNTFHKADYDNGKSNTYVTFNFGNERAIVSSAVPENYTYTLSGVYNNETRIFCEKLAYSNFVSSSYELPIGEWTFFITAYNGNNAVYSDTKQINIDIGATTVSFNLHAVTGGTGSVSVKLNFPQNGNVTTVKAALYDTMPSVDSGSALTINNSSVTFEDNAVPSGVNKILKFYLYNSSNACVATFTESIFVSVGDSINVERSLNHVNVVDINSRNIAAYINSLTGEGTITLTGELTARDIPVIKNAIIASAYMINLDLSNTTGLTSLPNYAFVGCSKLKSIILPDTLTSIGEYSLSYCGDLQSVEIPDSVLSIGKHAFEQDTFLENIQLSNSITIIEEGTFEVCIRLTSIEIPDGVTCINDYAFSNSGITCVGIPASVIEISDDAFSQVLLESINVNNDNLVYSSEDGVLFNKNKTTLLLYPCGKSNTSYTIPDSVNTIGKGAFSKCIKLTSVEIPNTVTSIGQGAFSVCINLSSIEIPDSVINFGAFMFTSCEKLSDVTLSANTPCLINGVFAGCTNLVNITIPASVTCIWGDVFDGCSKLSTVTYENPNGWYYATYPNATLNNNGVVISGGEPSSPPDVSTLTNSDMNHYWYKPVSN